MVPLCEILAENGKLEKEFELSTSELFHLLSGFVKLSITYVRSPPDLMEIPKPLCDQDSEECDQHSCELEKIEFPDPKIMNENEIMVSEYYSNKCAEITSQSTETDDSLSSDSNNHLVSGILEENLETTSFSNVEISPRNNHLVSRIPEEHLETTSVPNAEISPRNNSEPFEKKEEKTQNVVDSLAQPAISFEAQPDQKLVQQEFVDMYLKSMKQCTEALAKMKLPMDNGNKADSGSKDGKDSKGEGPNAKVFYGSRAFF